MLMDAELEQESTPLERHDERGQPTVTFPLIPTAMPIILENPYRLFIAF